MTIELFQDGNAFIAMIGPDPQVAAAGVGNTPSEPLRDLADAIEVKKWHPPEDDQKEGPIRRK